MEAIDPFVFRLSVFVLAIFVGYYVVWSVTPALHTPLMSVTNAISSVIVVGALIAVSVSSTPKPPQEIVSLNVNTGVAYLNGERSPGANARESFNAAMDAATARIQTPPVASATSWISKILGVIALALASVNIFGGVLVTQRMLAMYKKKEKPGAGKK